MIKISILSIPAFFLSIGLFAQTLQRSNLANSGDMFTGVVVSGATWAPGASGTAQTWDFSSFTGDNIPYNYVAVNEPTFPGSEMKVGLPGIGDLYFASTSNDFSLTGTYATFNGVSYAVPYSNPEKIFAFPYTYGMSFKDTAGGSFPVTVNAPVLGNVSGTVKRTVYAESSFDATGTLLLPGNTYNDALRIKITATIIDSAFVYGTTFITATTSTSEDYYWFSPNYKQELLHMSEVVANGSTYDIVVYFIPDVVTGILNNVTSSVNQAAYPNPATNQLNFNCTATATQIKILSMSGATVLEVPAREGKNSVSVTTLPTGIYLYEILDGESISSKGKFSKR